VSRQCRDGWLARRVRQLVAGRPAWQLCPDLHGAQHGGAPPNGEGHRPRRVERHRAIPPARDGM